MNFEEVYNRVMSWVRSSFRDDEAESIANLVIATCIDRYVPDNLEAYLKTAIRRKVYSSRKINVGIPRQNAVYDDYRILLEGLSKEDQELFKLKFEMGYSNVEIASMYGVNISTITRRINILKRKLLDG